MNVLNIRLDDRLVHGVVATNWIPRMGIDRAVVIDRASMEDPMMKSALRMATPKSVFLSVIDLEKFLKNDRENKYGNEKVMIIVKNLQTIIDLADAGFPMKEVILGNMGRQGDASDAIPVTRYLAVNTETIAQTEYLHRKGIKLIGQLIPENTPVDFYNEMIKAINK
ncbi:hypothetical protein C0033_02560 [Clostridium sp. chh4-2]|uniref:PTS system mannose/fructose/N-acetylgalactosamine-transporter subunit IIB n=1 Tax=Clostridium sp. chh4-2 TaxID=2067550 RepID=UPI000CCF1927|nr:PTS sugar transporter subunit IIB [Clostridium sp. chh4-2]PNV63562.1 hypothetical protein C0033_02560 [Clostridium sp. chh4-2]